jgi:hypothetical protein
MNTIPEQAREIVRAARLPSGKYGTSRGRGKITLWRDSVSAISCALAFHDATRIYRLADGWRFVGIITHDGQFVDERAEVGA